MNTTTRLLAIFSMLAIALAACIENSGEQQHPTAVTSASPHPEDDFNEGVHWFPSRDAVAAGTAAAKYLASHPREHVVGMTAVSGHHSEFFDGILVITQMENRP